MNIYTQCSAFADKSEGAAGGSPRVGRDGWVALGGSQRVGRDGWVAALGWVGRDGWVAG